MPSQTKKGCYARYILCSLEHVDSKTASPCPHPQLTKDKTAWQEYKVNPQSAGFYFTCRILNRPPEQNS